MTDATEGLSVVDLRVARGGREVVRGDLRVRRGECCVLVAPSGAGCSTLAAALAGALPASGTLRLDGRAVTGPPSRRRRLGLAACLPDLGAPRGVTVREAVALAAPGRGAVEAVLRRWPHLERRSGLDAGRLSGGERQLLRVACALATVPRALILDAPTVGLAGPAAEAVVAAALDAARAGVAVLWLDGPGSRLPGPSRLTIDAGVVTPMPEPPGAVRGSAPPGTASPAPG